MAVIPGGGSALGQLLLAHFLQPLGGAEAVVCLAFFYELFRVLHVDSGFLALTLDIRTIASVLVRTLVMDQAGLCQCAVDDSLSTLNVTLLVCILNTENEISSFMLCDQVCVKSCS